MSANDYHFITHWRVRSTVEEVSEILGDAPDLARWWPSVYLEVEEIQPGDKDGIGRVVALYTKGWLPYTLRWQFRVTESNFPHGFAIDAWGDFIGRGIWTFSQDGPWVDITYDWSIRADKSLLRYGSFLLKPIFSANHRWAMRMGEMSLMLELARRHAPTDEARSRIPPPFGPTRTPPAAWLVGAAGAVVLGVVVARRVARRKATLAPTSSDAGSASD